MVAGLPKVRGAPDHPPYTVHAPRPPGHGPQRQDVPATMPNPEKNDEKHDLPLPRLERRLNSTRRLRWGAPVWLVLVAFLLVALHVHAYTRVGPVDELQHIDYLYKVPAILASGDSVGQDAMREESCRGIDSPGFVTPACSKTAVYNPRVFQELGYNTAAINTPLYYTLTKVVAAPLKFFGGLDSLVTAGRLVGAVWLSLGLVLAYAAGRRLAIDRLPLAAVLTAFACAPAIVYPASTITPDAASFAAGAGVFLTCLYWEGAPRRRWPLLVLVSIIVLLLKMTNVMVLFAIGIYMTIRIMRALIARRTVVSAEDPRSNRVVAPWLMGGVVLSVTTAVTLGTILWIQRSLSHGDLSIVPMNQRFTVDAFPTQGVIEQFGIFINPLGPIGITVGNPLIQMLIERVVGAFFIAGIVGAGLFWGPNTRARPYAQAWLITAVIGGPLFVIVSYVGQSVYVPPPGRYAVTLVPAVAVMTAGLLKTRAVQGVVALGSVGLLAASVLRLLWAI